MSSTQQFALEASGFELTSEFVQTWGARSLFSMVDQGLTAGAGFLVSFLLARWLPTEAYGAFAVALATLIFLSGYHSVLLLEPICVVGPAFYPAELRAYLLGQLKVHAVLVAILSMGLMLVGLVMGLLRTGPVLIFAIFACACALPFLLLLWLARRMCYAEQCPPKAAWASAVYLVVVTTGLFILHSRDCVSPTSALLLIGGASVIAALLPLKHLGLFDRTFRGMAWPGIARENWSYGRWLVGSTTLFSVASQMQMYLVAAMLGLGPAGILRALQIPALVMAQLVTAVGLVILPAMSSDYGAGRIGQLRKKAKLATFFLTSLTVAYVIILAALSKPIEHLLYKGRFAPEAWVIPVLGLVPVFAGFASGFSMALRASRQQHFDLVANAVSAPVSLISAILFIHFWGIGGAALSMVTGFAAYSFVFCYAFRSWVRRGVGTEGASSPERLDEVEVCRD